MKRYIALLRGINISGKNKIVMAELKTLLEELGYTEVSTHLNSGNVAFGTEEFCCTVLAQKIRGGIAERFGLDIPVLVLLQKDLAVILEKSPAWWGGEDKDIYDNLIFVMEGAHAAEIAEKIGAPTPELEQVELCGKVIFWSFDRKQYAKANWWKKTAAPGIAEWLTIRTANTVRKLVML